ncbi:ATP-dependent DNA ligase [Rhizobium giardinii]|uniref:DNA ligase (ATP) n=1 Tax=Rhizobium giardinii TaxID=56731 RepID=A0A7W8UF58_9HYPH|nr:ATP-dependent DNA ligase [Rhizobium giardinii]
MLDLLNVKKPPIAISTGVSVLFAQPTIIVEVEYRAWSHDGKLRHPTRECCLRLG